MSDIHTCLWPGCRMKIPVSQEYCRQHVKAAERARQPSIVQRARQFASSGSDLSDEIAVMRFLMNARLGNTDPNDYAALAALSPDFNIHAEQVSRIVATNHKVRKESGAMLPQEQALALVDSITELLKEEFKDEPTRLRRVEQRCLAIMTSIFSSSEDTNAQPTPTTVPSQP